MNLLKGTITNGAETEGRGENHFAELEREQPVQFGTSNNAGGGCSRPVSFAFGNTLISR
jgi:hypothetical protein